MVLTSPTSELTNSIIIDGDYSKLQISASHAPIAIDGDSDFSAKASSEGWEGDGTEISPYLIRDYMINASSSRGIDIRNTTVYFIIQNVTAFNGDYGFYLYNVTNGKFIDNTATNNTYGFHLGYSDNNTFLNNNVTHNTLYNFRIWWGSSNNTFKDNLVDNSYYGIWFMDSNNNTIEGNKVHNNSDYGIRLHNSNNTIIKDNCINNSIYFGIYISNSMNTNIMNNSANNNGVGFYLSGSWNNTINRNFANNNGHGFELGGSGKNVMIDNIALDNYRGFHLDSSPNNILTNNSAYNGTIGFNFWSSENNTIMGNEANYNDQFGFFLHNSNNNTITSNTINYNYLYGIYLYSSNYSTISENILLGNGSGCIFEYNCIGNEIFGNLCDEDFPQTFLLSSTAGTPDVDGAFWLNWTESENANNYTIFQNDVSIIAGLTNNSFYISGLLSGDYEYYLVAFNDLGNTTSNIIEIEVYLEPHPFTLSTTAGNPDSDGVFSLIWTNSLQANNYSVYRYSSFITEINGSLTLIAEEVIPLSLELSGYSDGTYYFIVVAHNNYGDTLSNCIQIIVEIEIPSEPTPQIIPGYHVILVIAITALVSIAIFKRKPFYLKKKTKQG